MPGPQGGALKSNIRIKPLESDVFERDYMQPVPMDFNSIKDFFDHMKKKPAKCDGLALEVLIRNLINEEVSGI